MATIAEQLTSLANTKTAIKDAIVAKGVAVADTDPFSAYASKIGAISGGSATDEWQPNPNWWDIEQILNDDTRDYAGKAAVLVSAGYGDSIIKFKGYDGIKAIATSDGAFYSYADNGTETITHVWDTTKDKDDGNGNKTRWLIFYFDKDVITFSFSNVDLKEKGIVEREIEVLYLVCKCSISVTNGILSSLQNLECFKVLDGYTVYVKGTSLFCYNCYLLKHVLGAFDFSETPSVAQLLDGAPLVRNFPNGLDGKKTTSLDRFCNTNFNLDYGAISLDTTECENFNSLFQNNTKITKVPKWLVVTNKAKSMASFLVGCSNIEALPDNMDTSGCTSFYSFCAKCTAIVNAGHIDMSANTYNFTSSSSCPFNGNYVLKEWYLTLPSNTNFWTPVMAPISIESFRYMADHAPDVTATPRTLTVGSVNLSRINAADPTIITDLNAKGWTVA